MTRFHLFFLVAALVVVGGIVFAYKAVVLKFPISPDTVSYEWEVEANVSFVAKNKSVKVSLFIPKSGERTALLHENFISRGFGWNYALRDNNREVTWSIRKALGHHNLFYHAVVRKFEPLGVITTSKDPELEKPVLEGAYLAAAGVLLDEIKAKSADPDTLVRELLTRLSSVKKDDHVALLLGKKPLLLRKSETAAAVLALGEIPARVAHGIRLDDSNKNAPILHWLEVHFDKGWHPYNVETAESGVPEDYMVWWRGRDPISQITGGEKLIVHLSVMRRDEPGVEHAILEGHVQQSALSQISLFNLPLETQAVFRVVLLLPIGALVVVVLRNIVGMKTFGTFMPVLVALAFRETELLAGIAFFSFVVALGLAVRFYLEHLKLLLVPRLAAMLTVVVLILCSLAVLLYRLELDYGLSISLFPMVIMTMTIERMSIVWEELGAVDALKQGVGSLVAASLAYLVMRVRYIEHVVFVFPELLLFVLAATIILGRYTGYRLVELSRFRELMEKRGK